VSVQPVIDDTDDMMLTVLCVLLMPCRCIRVLLDAVHQSLASTSGVQLVNSLYQGTQVTRLLCKSCGQSSVREQEFKDINLTVKGLPDVQVLEP